MSPEMVVDCSALSVFNMPVSAVTATEVADGPTCMATSMRLVTATWTWMLVASKRLKPCGFDRELIHPGG